MLHLLWLQVRLDWQKTKGEICFSPSAVRALQAFNPSSVKGSLMQILSAIFAKTAASFMMFSNSVAATSAETGPLTREQISFVTSRILRPDLRIREGLVVTPSTRLKFCNSRISSILALSTKKFHL